MAQLKQRPAMVSTPAELRLFRAGCAAATQGALAQVLGIGTRSVVGWESGEHPMPALLPWALVAAEKHVSCLSLYRQRELSRHRKLKERRRREKLQRARASAKRLLLREAAAEHRNAFLLQQRKARKQSAVELRSLERAAAKLGPLDRVERGE